MDLLQIHPDENFGCIVLSGFDLIFENIPLPLTLGGCWISGELPFELDDWWRDHLGKAVTERLEKYPNLVLSSKESDSDEMRLPLNRAEWLLWGIAVIVGIPTFELARGIFGRIDERRVPRIHVSPFPPLLRSFGVERAKISAADFSLAAQFADRVEDMYGMKRQCPKLFWRVLSGFTAFRTAALAPQGEVRLHQFVRSIESFLPPSVFGEKSFADKATVLLSDFNARDLLCEIYRLRNKSEHHIHFEEAKLSGSVPAETADRRTRQAEALCRELYRRLFVGMKDFLNWYREDSSIEALWSDQSLLNASWITPFELESVK